MAFFGLGGYNEKTFVKNTDNYKNRLYDMMMETMGYEGVGKVLNTAMMALTKIDSMPKGADKKVVEAIDARIEKLLNQLNDDLQQKSQAKLSAHANMLLSAIADSRNYGKEKSSPQVLDAEEKMAETYANIDNILQQKDAIQQQMDEIYRKCQKVDESSSEFQRLEFQYSQLETQMQTLDVNLQLFKTQYDNCASILNVFHDGEVYATLDNLDVMKPAEFSKLADMNSRRLADRVSKQEAIINIGKEYQDSKRDAVGGIATTRSSLAERKAADEQARMTANINGASAPAQSAAPTSGLRSRLGK